MSSLKDSMRKRGISTDSGKSREDRGPGLEMPINRRAGRRSLFLKAGRGTQASGQGMKVKALIRKMGW